MLIRVSPSPLQGGGHGSSVPFLAHGSRLFFSPKCSSEASPSSASDRARQIPDEYLIDLLYSAESFARHIDALGSADSPPRDWGNVSVRIKSFVCLGKSIFIVFPFDSFLRSHSCPLFQLRHAGLPNSLTGGAR